MPKLYFSRKQIKEDEKTMLVHASMFARARDMTSMDIDGHGHGHVYNEVAKLIDRFIYMAMHMYMYIMRA